MGCRGWARFFRRRAVARYARRVNPLGASEVEMAAIVRWEEVEPEPNWDGSRMYRKWVLRVGKRKTPAATVWENGVWHTWDRSGVGGENSREPTAYEAKIEAAAAAIEQGFI